MPQKFKFIGSSVAGLLLLVMLFVPVGWFLPEATLDIAASGSEPLRLSDNEPFHTDNLISGVLMRIERAPWTAPVAIKQAPQKLDPFATVRITGLLMLPGKPPTAWIADGSQDAVKIQVGSDFKGWTVDSILATSIEFSKDSEYKILEQNNDK